MTDGILRVVFALAGRNARLAVGIPGQRSLLDLDQIGRAIAIGVLSFDGSECARQCRREVRIRERTWHSHRELLRQRGAVRVALGRRNVTVRAGWLTPAALLRGWVFLTEHPARWWFGERRATLDHYCSKENPSERVIFHQQTPPGDHLRAVSRRGQRVQSQNHLRRR